MRLSQRLSSTANARFTGDLPSSHDGDIVGMELAQKSLCVSQKLCGWNLELQTINTLAAQEGHSRIDDHEKQESWEVARTIFDVESANLELGDHDVVRRPTSCRDDVERCK